MSEPTPDASLVLDCPIEEYHSDKEHWSNSMFEDARESLERTHATHITKAVERKVTSRQQDTFNIGNATHAASLEPDKFGERWLRGPTENRKADKWTAAKADLPEGATLLQPSVFDMVELMAARVRCHPIVGPALEREGYAEASIYFTDPDTDLKLKVRPDWMVPPTPAARGIIVDLKTSKDDVNPDKVAKAFVNHGYHRQQALYSMGYRALFGEDPGAFVFAFVSKKPPHEVAAFILDDSSAELGDEQRRRDIRRVAASLESKTFSSPWNTDVTTLVLPSYAHFAD